jgi:hypothetical protein
VPGESRRRRARNGEDLLAVEAEEAREAMAQTIREMRDTLVKLADVRLTTRQHPWLMTGLAASLGIVVGAALAERSASRQSESNEAEPARECSGTNAKARRRTQGTATASLALLTSAASFALASLGTVFTGVLKGVLQSSITAAMAPPPEPADPE